MHVVTDSGLDIDALKIVADGVNTLRDKKNSDLKTDLLSQFNCSQLIFLTIAGF